MGESGIEREARSSRVTTFARHGGKVRGLRLRVTGSAVVFELANGKEVEVELNETANGNLLVRSLCGDLKVEPTGAATEVLVVGQ